MFWTVWETETEKRMLLLNTDWTVPGNEKPVTVCYHGKKISLSVREGTLAVVKLRGKTVETETWKL